MSQMHNNFTMQVKSLDGSVGMVGAGVLQALRELNGAIEEMDKKVEHVIKKHQAEFLYAYRSHIAKIKKELAEIKHKSEEQERMFSSNDRIQYLEKEMVVFREEALKLYAKVDSLTQDNDLLKTRLREMEKQHQLVEEHERDQVRASKMDGMSMSMLQFKNEELELEIRRKDEEVARLSRKVASLKEESVRRSVFEGKEGRVGSVLASTKRESGVGRGRVEVYESQMKEWFLECVRAVKREVATRNNSSHLLDISHISSIQEFKTVDKLRLLELFLQNEKLLVWMYERIFPDRLSKLRYNLSSHNDSFTSNDNSLQENPRIERGLLPKVNRVAKSELRNSLIIRNGKLNISNNL